MLISHKHKKVILNLRNPGLLLATIPTAKVFDYKGHKLVAVPHNVDETRVLRNMGYKIPSPVETQYEWSGQYIPFKAQLETTAFLTVHARGFVLNDMGCVDADTEYLSPTGWQRISEYTSGQVAQYDPGTRSIEFVEPSEYVRKPCADMLHIKTKYGLDQMLSPEHRVLLTDTTGKLETVQAETLYVRQARWLVTGKSKGRKSEIGYVKARIPVVYSFTGGIGLDLTPSQLRVVVATIADGYIPSAGTRCHIRLKKGRKVSRLRALLSAAGIEYREKPCLPEGFTKFSFVPPLRTKMFGADFWRASQDQLAVIADEVLHWDGCVTRGARFSTRERASADFIQHVFCSQGRSARVSVRDRGGKPEYTVQITDKTAIGVAGVSSTGGRLRNITWCPSPDGFKYCFMVPSTYLILRRNGCVFASGNTGKTLSTLWAFDYLRSIGNARRMLVVSPLSTLERTWADEIFRHFPELTWSVLYGDKSRRLRQLAMDADIYLINHDGIRVVENELKARTDIDVVVVDEIASFRNASTERWKSLNRICSGKARVWGLTGTPTPNAPTDAWAQCRLLCPDNVPKYFGAFRDMTMRQLSQFKWVAKQEATDIVARVMQPSIRFSRDDCIDLPPCTFMTRQIELSVEQKKAYREMLTTLYAEFQAGEVQAVNEAVKLSKLVQIASGVVYGKDGTPLAIPAPARVNEVLDVIEQAGSKVIVFVPFKGAMAYVVKELSKHHTVECINGDTSKSARDDIFRRFQYEKTPRVLVAQPNCMSHGLTLTAANTIVWYAPITSAEIYSQANARVTRPGQKLHQLVVNVEGSPVERKLFDRLRQKQTAEGLLLDIIKNQEDV